MFMRTVKKKHPILAGFLAFALVLIMGAGLPAVPAYAAGGTVYTCTITPCYRHPVTGVIEDSGGEASYATGQGMVESAVYGTGILEVTDTGEYYLTIRMSLMDYTSGHSFWVQNVGDTEWMTPAIGATGNGTDGEGTTTDICIQVPSENCVVRGAMYVEPMQRDVVFYFYPSNYVEGNNTDMNSTMISADTGSQSSNDNTSGSSSSNVSGSSSLTAGNTSLQSRASETKAEETAESTEKETERETAAALQSSITSPATSDMTKDADTTTLNKAQGLSLSTAEDAETETSGSSGTSMGQQIAVLVISITIAGLILLFVGAGIVYFFRKNWYRWGGGEDDDE